MLNIPDKVDNEMKYFYQIVFLAMLIPSLCNAEGKEHQPADSNLSGIVNLSPKLRNLLSREMLQLQTGVIEIYPMYISGNWAGIIPIATKMENSYVLKQNLTKEQVHELHSKLSNEFIELDQEFHYLSGMLAHAAKMQKPELVGFYFAKMNETCLSCHTKFATHKFPALAPTTQVQDH